MNIVKGLLGLWVVIHMKTALFEDDAQICAVPNTAWAFVKSGHRVTLLTDASAVTFVTKGFDWFNSPVRVDSSALDRATLPRRERVNLAEQMPVPSEKSPLPRARWTCFFR